MTQETDLGVEVRAYLREAGWITREAGIAGELWWLSNRSGSNAPPREDTPDPTLAVPFSIAPGSTEWRSVTERLAYYERRDARAVAEAIEYFYTDVTRLQATNDRLIRHSIPIASGLDLALAAHRLFRASATTARRPRAHIAGNFSRLGDEIVDEARLGQTEHGSYILPVLMPLTMIPTNAAEDPEQALEGIDRVAREPQERRVTRTLAQALTALSARIIEPAREPTLSDLLPIVGAGVSRELVLAVHQVLSGAAVSVLEVSFNWAGGVTAPASVPDRVSMPSEAVELLSKASRLLRTTRRDPPEQITGPIVEVRHLAGDRFGSISVQTVRHGRPAEIRVTLTAEQLDETYDWMRSARTVVAVGQVHRDPGHPLRIDKPQDVYPLDATFLPGTEKFDK